MKSLVPQNEAAPSAPPAARYRPFGEKATELMYGLCARAENSGSFCMDNVKMWVSGAACSENLGIRCGRD